VIVCGDFPLLTVDHGAYLGRLLLSIKEPSAPATSPIAPDDGATRTDTAISMIKSLPDIHGPALHMTDTTQRSMSVNDQLYDIQTLGIAHARHAQHHRVSGRASDPRSMQLAKRQHGDINDQVFA
jgi:hypothetical protein